MTFERIMQSPKLRFGQISTNHSKRHDLEEGLELLLFGLLCWLSKALLRLGETLTESLRGLAEPLLRLSVRLAKSLGLSIGLTETLGLAESLRLTKALWLAEPLRLAVSLGLPIPTAIWCIERRCWGDRGAACQSEWTHGGILLLDLCGRREVEVEVEASPGRGRRKLVGRALLHALHVSKGRNTKRASHTAGEVVEPLDDMGVSGASSRFTWIRSWMTRPRDSRHMNRT
jgi:hypothetical protein